jgi:hypothetical protein
MAIFYDGSLEGLFVILDGTLRGVPAPLLLSGSASRRGGALVPAYSQDPSPAVPAQPELFQEISEGKAGGSGGPSPVSGFSRRIPGPDGEGAFPHPLARELFQVSANALSAFIHAWMSEYPIEDDIIRFGERVLSAARNAGARTAFGISSPEARTAAEGAAADRGDPGTETVLKAAYRVGREIHRLMGFLRFTPDLRGRFFARCAPDHFSLPGLAPHFTRRFGAEPWAVIDERRGMVLLRPRGEEPRFVPADRDFLQNIPPSQNSPAAGTPRPAAGKVSPDPWEDLWRNYHRSINNEGRKNPGLQRQLMPARYWKYLPEMNFRDEGTR